MRCNWEKVIQDKELLSKVENWVRGLSIDSPQEVFDPAFDFDCFIANIVPEVVTLCDGSIAFQCSDAFDEAILCGAYAELDEELSFKDWHNF